LNCLLSRNIQVRAIQTLFWVLSLIIARRIYSKSFSEFDSKVIVDKKSVNMADLSALTAHTGDEFALFTKGKDRLIIRGNSSKE